MATSQGFFSRLTHSLSRWIAVASDYGRSDTHRINYLDGWRGVAIIVVLISHFAPFAPWFPFERVLFGRLGVDIFFVLSGLLMANILFVKRVPLKTFYKRRISRIFPVFILFVSLVYAIAWFVGPTPETKNFFYTLFFLRSYVPVTPDIWRTELPISHLWSLNVEEHCYVILSLVTLLWWARKREYLILLLLGCLAIITHYLFVRYPDLTAGRYTLRTETAASHLMLSAGYFLFKPKIEAYVKGWMPLLAMAVGFWCYSTHAPWFASWVIAPFVLAFAVNHLDKLPQLLLGLLSFKPLQLMGSWSYSIYLWQEPFYRLGVQGPHQFVGSTIFYLLLAILVGLMSFYWVENPLRRYLNQRWA